MRTLPAASSASYGRVGLGGDGETEYLLAGYENSKGYSKGRRDLRGFKGSFLVFFPINFVSACI